MEADMKTGDLVVFRDGLIGIVTTPVNKPVISGDYIVAKASDNVVGVYCQNKTCAVKTGHFVSIADDTLDSKTWVFQCVACRAIHKDGGKVWSATTQSWLKCSCTGFRVTPHST